MMTSLLRTGTDSRHIAEIASFGGSLYEKGPPPICRATLFPPLRVAMSSWHVKRLLVVI